MQLTLHILKRKLKYLLVRITDAAFFAGIVLLGGLGTSWYMVEAGSRLTVRSLGPWQTWMASGRPTADPYTRAHFARSGTLPLTTDIARTYLARVDSDGHRLLSSCEYVVEGRELPAPWWSLSVFDDRGGLIANPAQRYSFTSETMAIAPDGSFLVTLSRDARPANWLPTSGGGRINLLLTALDWRVTESAEAAALPIIRKVSCR